MMPTYTLPTGGAHSSRGARKRQDRSPGPRQRLRCWAHEGDDVTLDVPVTVDDVHTVATSSNVTDEQPHAGRDIARKVKARSVVGIRRHQRAINAKTLTKTGQLAASHFEDKPKPQGVQIRCASATHQLHKRVSQGASAPGPHIGYTGMRLERSGQPVPNTHRHVNSSMPPAWSASACTPPSMLSTTHARRPDHAPP